MKRYKSHKKKTIGELVKEYRKTKGISQMELAEMIGVSYQQVQKYEKGINRISVDRLKLIANALGIPISEFFSEKSVVSESPAVYGKMTADEQLLLHLYRELKDKKLKKNILELIKAIAK